MGLSSKGKKARQRQQRRQAARARARRRRIVIGSSILGVIAVVIAFVALQSPPEELAEVETFAVQGRDHLTEGETPPAYNSNPPTSGDHAPSAAQCGIYTEPIPDVLQVHNLEHGAVVIQYQPDLAADQVAQLEDYASTKDSHIVVAPRPNLGDPVVITSWARMLRLDGAEISTIDIYYDEFAFSGPEVGVACPFVVDQSS